MEFGSVTQKLEYEERFDTSGSTSESSNRTPSIESWEYGTGRARAKIVVASPGGSYSNTNQHELLGATWS